MKILVMPNLSRKTALPCTEDTIKKLNELGAEILMEEKLQPGFSEYPYLHFGPLEAALAECEFVIAIGGDGTILHTAKFAMQKDKPVFGINAGRLGFLAGLEANEIDRLTGLFDGGYTIEERMTLKIVLFSQVQKKEFYALNDAVIAKGMMARIVDLDIYCGDDKFISHRADGIIFATPTGSTAYSLSAGGPVIDPTIDCISMTPICSHSLLGRSIIFSDDKTLTVQANLDKEHEAYLSVDGEQGVRLSQGDRIEVCKSDVFIRFVKLTDKPFYEILNEKILEKMGD